MNNIHYDEKIRINNIRCSAFIFKDNMFLFMYRKKNGKKYFATIGGHMRKGESSEEVIVREIEEEVSIKVSELHLAFKVKDFIRNEQNYYYICRWSSGDVKLGGEELEKNSEENYYEPRWVPLDEIPKINLVPRYLKYWFLEKMK